ncbi:uncharacterized protein PAE49_019932 [Odontesthes bonariensis]|uniref:uncharacterized protein LOC142368010 n=1 Tax=Odontesthes bonariensis TaxID=219752 RepID=UPI003F5819B5
MAGLAWILSFLCAAGCHLSAPSPVLHSAMVVQTGQNVSLTCNMTSSIEITWYLLRSDQLLPLITVRESTFIGGVAASFHTANSHISWTSDPKSGLVSLEILAVEEEDAGLYFCVGQFASSVRVNRGIHLRVNGVDGQCTGNRMGQPCLNLGICVLPAVLALCLAITVGLYQCSDKPVLCCHNPVGRDARLKIAEEESLHYSSLRHPSKPRRSGRVGTGLEEESVTYSTVISRQNLNGC